MNIKLLYIGKNKSSNIIRGLAVDVNNVSTLPCFFWMFWIKIARKKRHKNTHETHMRAHSSFSFSYFCTTNHRANTNNTTTSSCSEVYHVLTHRAQHF